MQVAPQFFYYVAIMASLVLAFTGFKIAECKPFRENGEDFSWRTLIVGFGRHLIAISGLSLVYVVCSLLGADLALININGTEITIPDALNTIMLVAIAAYGTKLIRNAVAYFKVEEKIQSIEEVQVVPQTTFNNDTSVMDNTIISSDELVG